MGRRAISKLDRVGLNDEFEPCKASRQPEPGRRSIGLSVFIRRWAGLQDKRQDRRQTGWPVTHRPGDF